MRNYVTNTILNAKVAKVRVAGSKISIDTLPQINTKHCRILEDTTDITLSIIISDYSRHV